MDFIWIQWVQIVESIHEKHAFEYLSCLAEAWKDVAWSLLEARWPRSTALRCWRSLDPFSLVRFGAGRGGRQALL